MPNESFDAIVIGAGQAGPPLAVRCAKKGLRTAIIEREHLGGTCVNNGCIPTKTWVASARAAQVARRAAEWGVQLDGPVRVDMAAVKARKDRIVQESRTSLAKWLGDTDGLELIRGQARFAAPHTIDVGGRTLEAPKIFIDVGAEAARPPIEGLDEVQALDNRSVLELDTVPEHLVVVGGSYIGLEFAQMFRRFGSAVTVCEMGPRLVAREDAEVSDAIREILEREGIAIRLNAQCLKAAPRPGGGVVVGTSCRDGPPDVAGSHLLLATGRKPNSAGLGLDAAGIQCDARGHIEVDDRLRTNVESVWALGEVNGRGAFTHTSYNDYEIVAANLFDGGDRKVSDRILTYALFIDPPLGRCGMTERDVREKKLNALVATMPMSRVGRAREAGETQGFMKVLVDADSKLILGAALLGMSGEEAVHSILDIMAARQPYTSITHTVHIHPTVSELIPTLLEELKPLR